MNRNARQTIQSYNMLQRGDSLVVGISGGADSVALLHFLCTLRQSWQLTISGAHLNHSLRGEESMRDQRFVEQLCKQWDVPLFTETLDIANLAEQSGLSIETCAREQRYTFFSRVVHNMESAVPVKVATAHTHSDSLETMLLNLVRGTALRGLCGIPPVRDRYIRPLIDCTREQIEQYCEDNQLSFITDSSNLQDEYTRNRLRHHVVPVLRTINPLFERTAQGMLISLREDADYLDEQAQQTMQDLIVSKSKWNRKPFLSLPRPIALRVLLSLLKERSIAYDRERLLRLYTIVQQGTGAEQLTDQLFFQSDSLSFQLCKKQEPVSSIEPVLVEVSDEKPSTFTLLEHKSIQITVWEYEYFANYIKSEKKLLKNAVDCAKIEGIVKLRSRLPADSIRLAGRGCTKSLKKLMNEAKIPQAKRAGTVVLADQHGPIWVEGFGPAQRVAVTNATYQVWYLQLLEEDQTKGDK